MFRTVEDFSKAYGNLTAGTSRVLGELTDQSLDQAVADGYRTMGQIAWHIVVTTVEMMNRTGLGLSAVDEHALPPASAREIREAYDAASSELAGAVAARWADQTLLETDDMYGEAWPRGVTLFALISHEVHHRGQLTVLLRQAGAPVPGVFGPSRQEWAEHGMEPPPY